MSDSFKIQQNIKVNNDLINLRADTPDEFEAIANWVIANAGLLVNVQTALNGVPPALAANVTHTQVQQEPPAQQFQPQPQPQQSGWGQPQQAPQGNGPTCRHGARQWKEGTSKAGKAYKMWACPSQSRQDQCDPEWVR